MKNYILKYEYCVNGLLSRVETDFYTLSGINDFIESNNIESYTVIKRVKEVVK